MTSYREHPATHGATDLKNGQGRLRYEHGVHGDYVALVYNQPMPNENPTPPIEPESDDALTSSESRFATTSGSPFQRSTNPRRFQFDLTTILVWTAIVALYASAYRGAHIRSFQEFVGVTFFGLIFFASASTCIPFLLRRVRQEDGHRFIGIDQARFILLVGIYSMLSLMLATIGFEPDWKGAKGEHWFYYTLDQRVGMTLWPIYAVGVVTLISGVIKPGRSVQQPIYMVVSVTLTLISFWYVAAVLFLEFTEGEIAFAIVPGSVGVCYFLYAWILINNRQYSLKDVARPFHVFCGWIAALVASIGVKYPLAVRFYEALPDERPEPCFIVTAATRGHPRFVGTWYDGREQRWLNQQLLTFWKFERWLMQTAPRLQAALRFVYNRIAPSIARCVVYRWQADLIYALLKPLEWFAGWISCFHSRNMPSPARSSRPLPGSSLRSEGRGGICSD